MGFITPFPKKHYQQEQFDRFAAMFDAFVRQLAPGRGGRERHVTVIARGAESACCQVLCERAPALADSGVTVQTIFAKLGTVEPMRHVFRAVQRLNGAGAVAPSLRWAYHPSLADAHEQVTFGLRAVWTGDCMRRSPDSRNGLDLFEENSTGSVRLADLAFSAMWMASKPLPRDILDDGEAEADPMSGLDAASIAERLYAPSWGAQVVKLRTAS
jgi:hypothetical protein